MNNKIEESEEIDELTEIEVAVPYTFAVHYRIKVRDPEDLDEIQDVLSDKDPSDWVDDPCLYEQLGENFKYSIQKVQKDDVEICGGD